MRSRTVEMVERRQSRRREQIAYRKNKKKRETEIIRIDEEIRIKRRPEGNKGQGDWVYA